MQALSDLCALVQEGPLPPGMRQALGRAVMSPWQAAVKGLGPVPCNPGRGMAQPGATLVLQALDEGQMQASTQQPSSGVWHCLFAVCLLQRLLVDTVQEIALAPALWRCLMPQQVLAGMISQASCISTGAWLST